MEKTFTKTCEGHKTDAFEWECRTEAKNTIEQMASYHWHEHLAITVLDDGKTPVFWAGFRPGGEEGIDTREALADFISSVNGFQLVDTEWGQAAEGKGANNLENCAWDRQKNWWKVASLNMAQAMALYDVPKIIIALHKTLQGNFSFYKTVLYQAELPSMGSEMRDISTWNPEFEVHSIAVRGALPDESGCALASLVKYRLELEAMRSVTVWCRPCTTLQACGDKHEVEKKNPKAKCIEGDCQNGQGAYTRADGDIYQGGFKNGLKDGQGTYTWADGAIYQGGFKNGKADGHGTKTFDSSGEKYQGEYKNDKMDGQGTYTWADGQKYQGEWKKGLQDGQGTMTYPSGAKYQGGWKNDLEDGQGNVTLSNGDQYKVWHKEGQLTKKVKKKTKKRWW